MDERPFGSVPPGSAPSTGGVVFTLARALTYGTFFVAFWLVLVPRRVLAWAGFVRPPAIGPLEAAGLAVVLAGAALAVWCVLTFVFVGKGTPAPFDPPRQLVFAGPYRRVRNPMYLGAGLAMAGAAAFCRSVALLAYAGVFLVLAHALVVWYEEPTLSRLFGEDYESYRRSVRRWIPRLWSAAERSGIHGH